jgi:hypothetical protein
MTGKWGGIRKLGNGLMGLALFCLVWFYSFWVIPTRMIWPNGELAGPIESFYRPVTFFLMVSICWGWYWKHNDLERRRFVFVFCSLIMGLFYVILVPLTWVVFFVSFDWFSDLIPLFGK